jgi:hypothetical protein
LLKKQQIENVVTEKKQKELKQVGTIQPLEGHTLFEINTKTLEVCKAQYNKKEYLTWEEALTIHRGGKVKKEVLVKKDCVYISALNAENALERYLKNKGSAELKKVFLKITP